MKTNTKQQIIDYIKQKGQAKPQELSRALELYPTGLHRHLKQLTVDGFLKKVGSPPQVLYVLNLRKRGWQAPKLSADIAEFINQHYLYVSPQGNLVDGLAGFEQWVANIKQEKLFIQLAQEYTQTRKQADALFSQEGWIEATAKFEQTFNKNSIDQVYYQDFYSLPKFGKTKLGQLVLYAKQAENRQLIKQVAAMTEPILAKLIAGLKIDAIAYIPHSLPRQIPFLVEFKRNVNLQLPEIKLIKAYAGELPIAQKSLKKLEERIENAKESIYLKDTNVPYQRILLIDDAVGSGSTFQEVAKKIKQQSASTQVYGFAIVGSLKGFEVIQEV